MRIEAISAILGGAVHTARPVARVQDGVGFAETLQETLGTYEVRRGDTLSQIVARQLRAAGQDASGRAIYEGVERVAQANGIRNANRIRPGQTIDLSAIAPAPAQTPETTARAADIVPPRYTVEFPIPVPASGAVDPDPVAVPAASARTARVHDGIGSAPFAAKVIAAPASSPVAAARYEAAISAELQSRRRIAHPWNVVLDGPARITSEYGVRSDPFTGRLRRHEGIDIAATRGTSVYALASGRVVFSGWNGAYGNTVIVDHGEGLETVYSHQGRNLVAEGEQVTSATMLGEVGSTGRATAPHLHFEVRRDGQPVDPVPYVTGRSPVGGIQVAGP